MNGCATPQFQYDSHRDRMSNKVVETARIASTTMLHFDRPLREYRQMHLFMAGYASKHPAVAFSVIREIFTNDRIWVKFDNEAPIAFETTYGLDGSYDTIWLKDKDVKRFIRKVKHSKKMLVEAVFYRHGSKISEFNTRGF